MTSGTKDTATANDYRQLAARFEKLAGELASDPRSPFDLLDVVGVMLATAARMAADATPAAVSYLHAAASALEAGTAPPPPPGRAN